MNHMPASRLARVLDQEMIERAGTAIASAMTPDADLPLRRGVEVSSELGGRFLVRYMTRRQLGLFSGGSTGQHFVTPTPLSHSEVRAVLALPAVAQPRPFAMLIDPAKVADIRGPRWIRGGDGIEYLLPSGFPANALPLAWEIEIR
jgi:hypothetical protein